MIKPVVVLVALMILTAAACASPEPPGLVAAELSRDLSACQRPTTHGIQVGDLDRGADPCTDFYAYANGTWRSENPIPEGAPAWSRVIEGRNENRSRLKELLARLAQNDDWPQGSAQQLAGDYYASCMDEASIDQAGLEPVAPWLDEIAEAKSAADVQRLLRKLHAVAINVGFTLSGNYGYREPGEFLAYVSGGSLGLPDRDYYLKDEPRFVEAREQYRAHIARLLALAGTSDGADEIVALETRLAEASLDLATASNPTGSDHVAPFATLQTLASHFDWDAYFDEAKLPRGDLSINESKLLEQLDRELSAELVPTWKRYLTFQVLETAGPALSRPFADEISAFRDQYLLGMTDPKPRDVRCLESTETWLPDALGREYVARYFPPAAKQRLQGMLAQLVDALAQELPNIQWLTPETKTKALAKLATYHALVGYPDAWKDYAGVRIERDAYWANVSGARRFAVAANRRLIGGPTPRDYWQLPATATGAYIDFQLGQIALPAGFLPSAAFDLDATDAVSFGAIGAAAAHDITHGIDPLGSENDELGRPVVWWTDADREGFARQAQCVAQQYESYAIEPGVHFNGPQVQSEAVGDLAGVRLAYLALQKSMQTRPVPTVDGFTPEQQLFISYGQFRGAAETLERQRQLVESDSHPTAEYRVIGPLSNLPEFQRAFSCQPGAPMVRPADQRCAVW